MERKSPGIHWIRGWVGPRAGENISDSCVSTNGLCRMDLRNVGILPHHQKTSTWIFIATKLKPGIKYCRICIIFKVFGDLQ